MHVTDAPVQRHPGMRAPQRPTPVPRPTIRDVAREAGVSHSTVSRYLNGHKWVGEDAALAVSAAIQRVGFSANRFARSLKTGRSATVAFVLVGSQQTLFGDPNNAILLQGMTEALAERDMALVLMTASTDAERARTMSFVTGGHVDGVLLVSSHSMSRLLDDLVAARVPTVVCGRPPEHVDGITSVSADDRAGAECATAHLIATGCTSVATITGPLDIPGAQDRLAGYRSALAGAGLETADPLIATGDWTPESGRRAALSLLDGAAFDGLFVANDAMASGAMVALRSRGIDVPGQVAVAGFDDTGLAVTLDPPLTTMRQPFAAISRRMVRLLCDSDPTPVTIALPTELIVRESTRRPGPGHSLQSR